MGNYVVSYQSPQPEVVIWKPDYDKDGQVPLRFDILNKSVLQSYSFGTSINDEKGRFSLTFYPDDDLFDQIPIMGIVEFYESKNFADKPVIAFVGVIREKKFVAQMADKGANRKFVVTGHSVVGLVHEFKMNFDMQATVITKELANNEKIQKEFTIQFIQSKILSVSYVIKKIWESFINLSSEHGRSSKPLVGEYIKRWIGEEDDIFDVDDSMFHYPIASVFKGDTTQTFFDVIANLIPKPVYEIFPYIDVRRSETNPNLTEKMRLKIREVPFDTDGKNTWENFMKPIEIKPKLVKTFDLKQTDNEVYTVFFSYLSGYPIQQDKAIILAAQKVDNMPGVEIDKEKFKVYGYRPLFVTFNGYGNEDGAKDNKGTEDAMSKLNERLKNWYVNKDKFFSGSITMETDLNADMPQAGEKISFLGGEFYVTDSEHNWTFGGSLETRISVDRGGDYSKGVFAEIKGVTNRYKQFKGLQNVS